MKILFHTLGCKVNQAESGGMEALLRAKGHTIVTESDISPDAVVVNTCTVTAAADQKSRRAIRHFRNRYPRALLCVCGCLSQTRDMGAVVPLDLEGGSGNKSGFVEALDALLASAPANSQQAPPLDACLKQIPDTFDTLPDAPPEGRCRAFLKIQDGCGNHCTYCRIPAARGPSRSRPLAEVVQAARRAACKAPELVLCGIEISSYEPSLVQLTEAVCHALPDTRVRLGSLDPLTVSEDFARRLSALEVLCPHFHLSVQSCSDKVLAAMGRRYRRAELQAVFARLRRYWHKPAVTADILTGFPGESEADFEDTYKTLTDLAPAGLHVFPYSKRADTPAALMPAQVPNADKKTRSARLLTLHHTLRADYLADGLGTVARVLYETWKNGLWYGHTPEYMPVYTPCEDNLRGVVVPTRLTDLKDEGFVGCAL